MVVCTVCGDAYLPTGRWRDDTCDPCFTANFAASQELRVHDVPLTDAHREAEHRRYVEACQAAAPPTPRQVEAMRRMAARWLEDAPDGL